MAIDFQEEQVEPQAFDFLPDEPDQARQQAKADIAAQREQLRREGAASRTAVKIFDAAERAIEPLTPAGLLNQPARVGRALGAEVGADPFQAGVPQVTLPKPTGTGVAAGLGRLALGVAEGLTTPEMLVTLPAAPASAAVRALFAGEMAKGLPESIGAAGEVLRSPEATTADKVEAAGQPLVAAAFIRGLAKTPELLPNTPRTLAMEAADMLRKAELEARPQVRNPLVEQAPRIAPPEGMVTRDVAGSAIPQRIEAPAEVNIPVDMRMTVDDSVGAAGSLSGKSAIREQGSTSQPSATTEVRVQIPPSSPNKAGKGDSSATAVPTAGATQTPAGILYEHQTANLPGSSARTALEIGRPLQQNVDPTGVPSVEGSGRERPAISPSGNQGLESGVAASGRVASEASGLPNATKLSKQQPVEPTWMDKPLSFWRGVAVPQKLGKSEWRTRLAKTMGVKDTPASVAKGLQSKILDMEAQQAKAQREIDNATADKFDQEQTDLINRIDRGETVEQADVDRLLQPDSDWRAKAKIAEAEAPKLPASPAPTAKAEPPAVQAAKGEVPNPSELPNSSPARETVTPANDTSIGKNAAGEALYQRADGSVYRMRFDSPKTKPQGYPDFGGDLAPVEQAPTTPKAAVAKAKNLTEAQSQRLAELTDKVEAGGKLTAAERKAYTKLRDKATGTKPEAVTGVQAGVGEGMGAAKLGETDPRANIEILAESMRGVKADKVPFAERVAEGFDLPSKREAVQNAFTQALAGLKSAGDAVIEKWKGVNKVDDLLRAKGELSADIERRGWQVRKWVTQAQKSIPRKRDQAAIAKWIDAGGDMEVLRRGAAETKPRYRQAYLDAIDLKGDLLIAAQNARNYFESRLVEAIDAGVLKDGVEDYIHRIYESRPKEAEKAIARVQASLLQPRPDLAKTRVFQFDWEAEKLGYRPVQSFITRIAQYEASLAKAIASREFIKKATTMKAADGRPVVDIKGVGIPLENAEGIREGTLIKPQFNPARANEPGTPNYRGDYVNKEFPSLSRWKWVTNDASGKPIYVQGDVAIHPDFVGRINALLEPSRVKYGRYGWLGRPALKVSSTVKQTMLDLSLFHQVQITVHGAEHKVAPWKIIEDIDFTNPNVDGLLKGGITLGGDYSGAHYSEGLIGGSLTKQIPFLGPLAESYHGWLFQSYIPRIKMTMALGALERNRARYKNTLSEEQIFNKTASQANSAFGELNYTMLERSKTAQDISRLIMLAPDFLEARARFAGEAFSKGGESKIPGFGNEQRAALLLGALTMFVTARMANKALDDQWHFEPENAFSIVYKGRSYSLRTVQGDILHLIEHPLQFWMHRLNPVYGRTLLQMVTGRDYFGRKRSVPETLWDSVANIAPISLRHGRERKLWESMLNSTGVNARRYNAADDAFQLAQAWKEKHGIGAPGEFIYDSTKDPLRPVKLALAYGSETEGAKEIRKLLESGYSRRKLIEYFDRYAKMPFTGSKANDYQWLKTLTEDQKKTVEAAQLHKKEIRDLFLKARTLYDEELIRGQQSK